MDEDLRKMSTDLLKRHESSKNHVYMDSTNHATIGIGRNISATGPGLRDCEIAYMLSNDQDEIYTILNNTFPWFSNLNNPRKAVIIDLCFNLGFKGLMRFEKFLDAMNNQQYQTASTELLSSLWASQVRTRAVEDSKIILYGIL